MPCNSQASSGDAAIGGVVMGHEGTHGDVKLTQEPQKPLTFSELLEIETPLASQEEQPLQGERSAEELRSQSA
ncbi:hypothetical protein MRX96_050683 [Rhipicephalus microplus]